jgi:hypothetical protein
MRHRRKAKLFNPIVRTRTQSLGKIRHKKCACRHGASDFLSGKNILRMARNGR